jgi:hypothetical protein
MIKELVIYQCNIFNDEFLFYVVLYFLCPARGSTLITVGFSLRINTTTHKSPTRDEEIVITRHKHIVVAPPKNTDILQEL